jgi:hypothetical protein
MPKQRKRRGRLRASDRTRSVSHVDAAMPKQPKRRGRLRVADIPVPKKVSKEDFIEICGTFRISASHQQLVRTTLDNLVEDLKDWMNRERSQSHRRADRNRLNKAVSSIKSAIALIQKLGPSGRLALKAMSQPLAPMLSAQWINLSFPDDDYAPQRSAPPPQAIGSRLVRPRAGRMGPQTIRMGSSSDGFFIEEHSLESRFEFVSRRAMKATTAALMTIELGLEKTLRSLDLQPGSWGGRKRLIYRHSLLIKLAEMWDQVGKKVSSGTEFAAFCESVARSIGWPTDGINSAIPDAIRDWRNRTQKIYR